MSRGSNAKTAKRAKSEREAEIISRRGGETRDVVRCTRRAHIGELRASVVAPAMPKRSLQR